MANIRTIKLTVGATYSCTPTYIDQNSKGIFPAPAGASYASSAPSVASVDPATGKVTAVAPGNATITATSGDLSAQLNVQVYVPVPTVMAL